ncbi:MAG: hypothetical protein KDA22_03810 [Phycisphaerales bacterium]|nr:hypothetical protein [Phycisphaerales bacterium]
MSDSEKPQPAAKTFADEAARENPSLLSEFWDLILHEKKWWLIPIIVVLLAIGLLVVLGSSAVAPFIYPLF